MFPLCDVSGRVVGFSGRILNNEIKDQAKYVNSPQTDLYDKSNVLYGYDKAKLEIKKKDHCVLVEGQMDLVLSHQAGVENAIAVSGTALTEKHLNLVKRLTDNLIMAFDGDLAGISASRRAVDLALSLGMEVKGALLPEGLDPADLVVKDKELWIEAVAKAKNIIDFYLDILSQKNFEPRVLNAKITAEVLPYVARVNNAMDQAHFVAKISSFLRVGEEAVWTELHKIKNSHPANYLQTETKKVIAPTDRTEMISYRLFSFLYWLENVKAGDFNVAEGRKELEQVLGTELYLAKENIYLTNKDQMAMEAEISLGQMDGRKEIFNELINNLRADLLKEELKQVMLKIREAEVRGDAGALEENLKKCQTLTIEINKIKK
jgi:DNA primase